MSRRWGQPKRFPIIKLGWKSAKEGIDAGELTLLELADGHAELLGTSGCNEGRDRHSEAHFFLTKRSTQLLKEALAADKRRKRSKQ